MFNGRVDQILPSGRSGNAHRTRPAYLSQPRVVLKPGMYVNADINIALGRQLVIPATAVLQSGSRVIAFIDHGDGRLEPREIQTGPQIDDSIIVLKGLQPGDRIVSSANFLVDSEAQLQAALGLLNPAQQNPAGTQSAAPNQPEQIQIEMTTEPSTLRKGKNTIRIKLTGADGKPVDNVQVTAVFFMPAMPGMGMASQRASAEVQSKSQGIYEGALELDSGGTWQATVSVSACRYHRCNAKTHRRRYGGHVTISRIIALCARNPFLVFTGAILLTVAGVWSLRRVPLDALPDISDVQVVVHTNWPGEPPDIVEDQVTYPIVTALLAAPHVQERARANHVRGFPASLLSSTTAPTCTGRAPGFSNTCNSSPGVCHRMLIRRLALTPPAPAGSMSMPSSIARTTRSPR